MEPKRRLPVLRPRPAAPPASEGEDRPPWHWVGFGTAAIFAAWLPLAYAAEAARARAVRAYVGEPRSAEDVAAALAALSSGDRLRLGALTLLLALAPFAAGTAAGGYLVGRFGGKAGAREAALAGAGAAALASTLAVASSGLSLASGLGVLVAFAVAIPSAALGARAGKRARAGAASA